MDMTLRAGLRAIVARRLAMHGDRAPFGDGDPLLTSGRLDSLDAVELVMALEADHGIDFAGIGFDLVLLDSVAAMAELVERRRTAA